MQTLRLIGIAAALLALVVARSLAQPLASFPTVTATPTPDASGFWIPGTTITLTVNPNGSTPLGYQWYKNQVQIPGATAASLVLGNVQAADAGIYSVSVSVGPNTTVLATAYVPVVSAGGPQPGDRLWIPYRDVDLAVGTNWILVIDGLLSVRSALGDTPVRWYKNGTLIPGATASTLPLSNFKVSDAGTYYATWGPYQTNNAILRVESPPVFAIQPESTWSEIGGSASFSFSLVPTGTLTIQWYRNGVPIPGANSPSFDILSVTAADFTTYTVTVSNTGGTTTSQPFTLSRRTPPTITRQPASQNVAVGGTVSLSVEATGAANILPLTYQWQKDNLDIPGATGSSLTIPNAQAENAGIYQVMVSGRLGYDYSSRVTVTVGLNQPVAGIPGIATQMPATTTVTQGGTVTLSVGIVGNNPMGFQWFKDGLPLAGATSSSLTLSNVPAIAAGSYTVVATNNVGTVTSSPTQLVVQPAPSNPLYPAFLRQPASFDVDPGSTVTFSVEVTGGSPLSLTWLKNNKPITGLASAPTLTLANVQAVDEGDYSVRISNTLGQATSQTATLRLSKSPEIVQQPEGRTVIEGSPLVLSVVATGAPVPTYQWYRDGSPIPQATISTYTLGDTPGTAAGHYHVVVSNRRGSVTSTSATVTVAPRFALEGIYFGSFGASAGGGPFALRVKADGSAILIGQLRSGGENIAFNFTVNPDGTFRQSVPRPAAAQRRQLADRMEADAGTDMFSGQIAGGQMTGTFQALNASLSGAVITSGASSQVAGYYEAPVISTGAVTLHSIVAPNGQFLLVTIGGAGPSGAGTISGNSQLAVQGADGSAVVMTINPGTGSLSGTVITNTGSQQSVAGVRDDIIRTDRLIGISTRGIVGSGDQVLIAGIVVAGDSPKNVLLRAVGPTLGSLGVGGALTNSHLALFQGSTKVNENDDWGTGSQAIEIASAAAAVGDFPLPVDSKDAAILTTLAPGAYTAIVSSATGQNGVALVEAYDVSEATAVASSRLYAISTRGFVGRGDGALIAGVAINGNAPKRVLIRAVGPGLAAQGVSGVLADPRIRVYREQTVIGENDDWGGDATVAAAAAANGNFALAANSKDAAMLITLQPGVYTAQVSGVGDTEGVALIEIYEVRE